ncbi:MBOAT family protein [bacterium 1XD42-1]|nr:MBOAT family protein [bacterium 1XD42-8]RKJ63572.1 MBOAT family protein [bacterium 1XD42-1]
MSFLSPSFFVFILICLFIYYLIPKRFQWYILLIASLLFYCWGGRYKAIVYLLCTAFSTWLAALMIDALSGWVSEYFRLNKELSKSERKVVSEKSKRTKKIIFLCGMVLNILILCIIKYTNFAIKNIAQLWSIFTVSEVSTPVLSFLVPLGISFYTFQSLGYLIDVYWGKYRAEKNFAKYLLFVSYFPQIVQGPIGRYDQLAAQLTKQNQFQYENLKHGAILMLWGYMKKLVIADRIAPLVATVCKSPGEYDGSVIVLAIFTYAIQLYADFSGGIDIVTGISEMFAIRLSPNFMRPYFATSLGDFWRRWHISLGAWMRDYVFYPFARSKFITKTCKKLKGLHKKIAALFPAMVGNILVFFLVGIWHGAEWRYIFWGLYNGIILALSILFKPLYSQFYEKFPQTKECCLWHIFQVIRTFIIVCIGYYFDCCTEISEAFLMLKKSIFGFHFSALLQDNILKLGMEKWDYIIAVVAVLLLLTVSFFQERGVQIRFWLDKRNIVLRWSILYGLIFFIIAFSITGVNAMEGFMYAIF